jgi:hypothetical protein
MRRACSRDRQIGRASRIALPRPAWPLALDEDIKRILHNLFVDVERKG